MSQVQMVASALHGFQHGADREFRFSFSRRPCAPCSFPIGRIAGRTSLSDQHLIYCTDPPLQFHKRHAGIADRSQDAARFGSRQRTGAAVFSQPSGIGADCIGEIRSGNSSRLRPFFFFFFFFRLLSDENLWRPLPVRIIAWAKLACANPKSREFASSSSSRNLFSRRDRAEFPVANEHESVVSWRVSRRL